MWRGAYGTSKGDNLLLGGEYVGICCIAILIFYTLLSKYCFLVTQHLVKILKHYGSMSSII